LRLGGIGLTLLALVMPAWAQYQPPSQSLQLNGTSAYTWQQAGRNVVQLDGPVTIDLDRANLAAQSAVVWLEPAKGGFLDEQIATIALIGGASLEQSDIRRSGDRLLVSAHVRGAIRITADQRIARDMRDSAIYQQAAALESSAGETPSLAHPVLEPPATEPTSKPTTWPSVRTTPILFHGNFEPVTTRDGKLGLAFTEGVVISRQLPGGESLEMQADRAVLFTTLTSAREVGQMKQTTTIEEAIVAAYLEGDVRINSTPAEARRAEQRLEAQRVYYEFTTNRAVLTDVVIHTMEPLRQVPVVIRAETVRQLSEGEYRTTNAQLTTSSFAVPSYSINADKAYIRRIETDDPRYGARNTFIASPVTFNLYNFPVFWLPVAAGSLTDKGQPLRDIEIGHSNDRGFAFRTEWGLLESLGQLPPKDVDLALRADYFSDRGPGAGLNGEYGGGFITETSKKISNFQGDFRSYLLPDDTGFDNLGRSRRHVDPDETLRGRVMWEHQHFFPDDWQLQLRTGWVSDPTFRESWFQGEFNEEPPLETSAYIKRQKGSEAMTLLASIQPNNLVTTANGLENVVSVPPGGAANKPFEVERVPEIGYQRIGESLGDSLTLFSQNTVSGLHFNESKASLAEYGFHSASPGRDAVLPGLPALGTTGTTDDTVYRGDFRQEVDWPFSLDQFRMMPYVVGRYTPYSDSPDGDAVSRAFAGTGMRINTTFWKIDDSPESELFDIHRVRHVIEPELQLFTSAQTADRGDVFVYDQDVDAVNDISAAEVALRQRWQTKRGGPGNERSVDFFRFSVAADFYANQPSAEELNPTDFRGLFFGSMPEASVPRQAINSEAMWRVSDSTVILADAQHNLDEQRLATAAIGMAARRGDRLGYFIGTRYIDELSSAITTVAAQYQLTPKYTFLVRQSFDFGLREDVYESISIQRKFDRFYILLTIYHDAANNNSGFGFAFYPEGLGRGLQSEQLQTVFGTR
jgi:hypothetical protein